MRQSYDPLSSHARDHQRHRRLRPLPIRSIIPNMLTVLALCSGLTAIRFALTDKFEAAIIAIVVAAILDGLDGRVARLLNGSTKFGAELDTLSDFANFGIVPVTVLYVWTLGDLGGFGWIVVLAYCICCALRLARFNVMAEDPDRPAWKSHYFTGIPAPAAAGLCVMPFLLSFLGVEWVRSFPFLIALYTCAISFLMVSRIPTFSSKGIRIKSDQVLAVLVFVGLFAALMIIYTWETLLATGLVYLICIPLSVLSYRNRANKHSPEPSDESDDIQFAEQSMDDIARQDDP